VLKRETYGHKDSEFAQYILTINLDMGAVFGHAGPGERMLAFRWDIEAEEGIDFMRAFIDEIERANQGLHPDPGSLPMSFSDWPFAREINRRAYDKVSTSYKSNDFDNPLLAEAFQRWLSDLPEGAHILDTGCGSGSPVIEQLLASGFQVTGCDLSHEMLSKARQQFPEVEFREGAITELKSEALFEGACSFSSMLYLDLIDFFQSIHRLYLALKPGGLLFLYGYDLHPSWRGMPYHVDLKQWLWGGTRGIDETVQALEEHGYFKVLKTANVITEDERLERIEGWRTYRKKEYENLVKNMPPDHQIPEPDLSTPPANLAYPFVVVAQKQAR
jgi:SAM-dependent methyltransferase